MSQTPFFNYQAIFKLIKMHPNTPIPKMAKMLGITTETFYMGYITALARMNEK